MIKSVYTGLLMILCFFVSKKQAVAQTDPHFTQNYMYPMAVNPALTGAMDGSYRVSSIYRNQWKNISNPYSTVGVSAEIATPKNINIGVSYFKQTAGDSGYQYNLANISLAYSGVKFGKTGDQQISFAAQGGFVNSKFDASGFKFGQQWQPGIGYVSGTGSGENIDNLSAFIPDITFGVYYLDRTPNKTISAFGGVSTFHVTQPRFSFLGNIGQNKLPMRLSAQAGIKVVLKNGVFVVPNVIYNRQGTASEIIAATYAQFFVNDDVDVMLGGNMRLNDSVSPFVGLYFKGLIVGLSYDVNTSSLQTTAPNSNAFELSISFTGGKSPAHNSVYFNCPRF